jgi:hypothetical protein
MKIKIIKESLDTKELFKAKKEIEGLLKQGEFASAVHFAEMLEVPIHEINWYRYTYDLINTRSEFLSHQEEILEFARWVAQETKGKPKFHAIQHTAMEGEDYLDYAHGGQPLSYWIERYDNPEEESYVPEAWFREALTKTLESLR